MAGYDISASYSQSNTLGSRAGEGDFVVYGKGASVIPSWAWILILGMAAVWLWRWFKTR